MLSRVQAVQAIARFLQTTDPGWARAWDSLRATFGDVDAECACCGERWQYLGTFAHQHEFRHRCLPTLQERTYFAVPVEPGDFSPPRPMTTPEFVVDL